MDTTTAKHHFLPGFGPTEQAAITRWNATEAPLTGLWVQTREGYAVERAENGDPYIVLAWGGAEKAGCLLIEPRDGAWAVEDTSGAMLGAFARLQGALSGAAGMVEAG